MKTDEGTEQRFLDAQNSKGSMFNSNQHVTVSTRYASIKRPFASRRVLGVCLMSSFAWLFLGGCSQGHPTVRAFRGSRLFHPETRVSHTTGLRPRPPVNRLLHISLLLTYLLLYAYKCLCYQHNKFPQTTWVGEGRTEKTNANATRGMEGGRTLRQ